MTTIAPDHIPLAFFTLGILVALALSGLWRVGRFLFDIRVIRNRARQIELSRPSDDKNASEAWERVSACRKRLRFNPNPNPEWIAPLIIEIPRLVREIAAIYYPNHPDPVQAPRLSEFARAIQYMATEIAQLLQTKRMGRMIDLSAGQTLRAWKTGNRVWKDPVIQKARGLLEPVLKIGKPIWQVVSYNSPITWVSITASNAAVRTIQPSIVNIIARRAIDLYSGKLSDIPAQEKAFTEPPVSANDAQNTAPGGKRLSLFGSLKHRFSGKFRRRGS